MSANQVTVPALLCLVGFAAGWTMRGGSGPPTQPSDPPSQSKSESGARLDLSSQLNQPDLGETRQVPASDSASVQPEATIGVEVDPTMSEALAALDRAIRLRPIYEDQDEAFAAKYEGASSAALREALNLVRARVEAEQESIIKDRMAGGQYEERVLEEGDRGQTMKGSGKGISTFGTRKEPGPNGTWVVKTTEITAEEYPEFNAGRMEMWWLIRALRGK